jgi:hypothetical protein
VNILSRTGVIIYTSDKPTIRAALIKAVAKGAILTRADLTGAILRGAHLTDAILTRADLRGADLTGAILRGAHLTDAILTDAILRGADLRGADLRGAHLTDAILRGAYLPEGIPSVPLIDAAILTAIEQPGNALNMHDWHTCKTTHCRAGWAIVLAGEAGQALEDKFGPAVAGALIYAASGSHPVPDFGATNKDALADMRARARASK